MPSTAVNACLEFSNARPGVTMYPSAARFGALLRNSIELAGPAGRVVFTFMEQAEDGAMGFRGEHPLISRWLQSHSEPFL